MPDCLFLTSAEGQAPARIIYQDERALAIEDIQPRNPPSTCWSLPENTRFRCTVPAVRMRLCWDTCFWWLRKWRGSGDWNRKAIAW